MKGTYLAVLMCLFPLAATATDARQAVRAHMKCVIMNAIELDDGRMDNKRLAKMILPRCRREHEAAMLASSPQSWRATPKAEAREMELLHTIAAVALYRDRRPR